jgi:hypothetical protein
MGLEVESPIFDSQLDSQFTKEKPPPIILQRMRSALMEKFIVKYKQTQLEKKPPALAHDKAYMQRCAEFATWC